MKYLAIAAFAAVSFSAQAATDASPKEAFSKLKAMVGSWEQPMGGHKYTATYRLTGGGSALMETLAPGSDEEMMTMYFVDKNRLLMTHYCAAHNQPTLRFVPDADPNVLHFVFISGTNMSPTDMHIHDVKFKFVDKDHVLEDWQSYADGKPGEHMKFDFHRVG